MDPRSPGKESFGTSLLRSVPKITARHEEELKLLESLHQHMNKRAKADMEYAAQLAKINAAALRACPKDTQDEISSIIQIWSVFLQATDKIITKINQNAQQMRTLLTTELQPLIRNKRSAGTAFDKDRLKAEDDYHTSCTEVDTLHDHYGKYARKSNKNKDLVKKAKPAELERVTQHYAHVSCRLHTCHNSYILAIHNANNHQHYYKTVLLPFTFDTFQERMELHVGEWKNIMEKYVASLDLYEMYEEANKMIYAALAKVGPTTEYQSFIHQNRNKDGPALVSYEFDATLVKIPIVTIAPAGQIALNNLTATPLKEKLSELYKSLEAIKRQITDKLSEAETARRDLVEIEHKEGRQDNERAQQLTVRISIVQGEVENLKCKESRLQGYAVRCPVQVQADVIQQAFDKVGGEGVIPPHFDPEIGDITIDFSTLLDEKKDVAGGSKDGHKTIGKKLGKMWSKFRQRGKSITLDTTGPTANAKATSPTPHLSLDGSEDEEEEEEEVNVNQEPWYYDLIPRADADRMVKLDGDYLVRFSDTKGYVLTTKWEGQARHFVIQKLEDENGYGYRFEGTAFPTIRDLLTHYTDTQTPITKRTQAVLRRPICKQVIDDDRYTMNRNNIILDKVPLGKGNFGDVYSGTLKDSGRRVAVKTCRSEHIPEAQQFLAEAKILKQYNHPNIVRLLGVCADKEPVFIVMELMTGGDFLHFLRKHGANQTQYQLTKFALDAALGMEYLAQQNCIHRDLAARNCLVGERNEILKISDFGMSRETEEGIYTPSSGARPIPVKWTAPEALNLGQYTSASDVWSYGILLYETYSCGGPPYPGMSNAQARESTEQGHRMEPPEGTPREVYDKVMWECWHYEADDRPSFSDIVRVLKVILPNLPKK